jgi:pimeloyl-ACP methyl ester carboxylesterase
MVWDSIYASLNMSLFIIIFPAYDNTTLLYEILKSIKWARKTYGNLPVNVVGHSIGGDLASFYALGLFVCTTY